MIKANIITDTPANKRLLKKLSAVLKLVVSELGINSKHIISYVLTDNATVQQLNTVYRHIDAPTDVLSFATIDGMDKLDPLPYELGDVVISLEKALVQSTEYGHSLEREVIFLALHGTLHVLGYDHQTPEQEHIMFGIQKKIVNQIWEQEVSQSERK